jgi:hypothetical protein
MASNPTAPQRSEDKKGQAEEARKALADLSQSKPATSQPVLTATLVQLEKAMQSPVIAYVTSVRWQLVAQMSQDAVREFFDHLLNIKLKDGKKLPKITVFVVSNGGDSVVPWQLTACLREVADAITLLVPYRAYSAATLLALGADEIIMGPFGQLGPIDPAVQNDFNPDAGGGQKLMISVEDVKSYVRFIKSTVGITHEDELIKAVTALTDKVHPLALGNVERFISQSRMIATKLLQMHMPEDRSHLIKDVVEMLASKFYFHGHSIGREEARELGLNVINATRPLESLMWNLFLEYERLGNMHSPYDPGAEITRARIAAEAARLPEYTALVADAKANGANSFVAHQMAETMLNQNHQPVTVQEEIPYVFIDSRELSSRYIVNKQYELLPEQTPGQPLIRQEVTFQGWRRHTVPTV